MPYALTFTGSRPFQRGTPSSPVENCMYLPFIYDIQLNAVCINFCRVQIISTRDAIISSGKLYVIKCLMHLLTIVYVNIEICCKSWYCWFFFSDFYMFQAISTRDAIISSWKLYVFIFHLWYSIKCRMHRLLQGPDHFDEGSHHLHLKTVSIYVYITLNTRLIVCAHDCIVFVFKQ